MTGQKHGRLTFLRKVDSDGSGRARWLCRCDCGREVIAFRHTVLDKRDDRRVKSCGCARADRCRANGEAARNVPRLEEPREDGAVLLAKLWGRR